MSLKRRKFREDEAYRSQEYQELVSRSDRLKVENPRAAIKTARKAWRIYPSSKLLSVIVHSLIQLGRTREAVREVKNGVMFLKDKNTQILLSTTLMSCGHLNEALAQARKGFNFRKNENSFLIITEVLRKMKRYSEAQEYIRQAKEKGIKSYRLFLTEAFCFKNQQQYNNCWLAFMRAEKLIQTKIVGNGENDFFQNSRLRLYCGMVFLYGSVVDLKTVDFCFMPELVCKIQSEAYDFLMNIRRVTFLQKRDYANAKEILVSYFSNREPRKLFLLDVLVEATS